MTDLGPTIAPRSDQLNSDDLIAGPITITITKVSAGNAEQPINVHYEGDGGKPYKPGKSMRRVLVHAWGRQGDAYVGRKMTLYRDPTVQFGGIAVGGIRISHMSHIDRDFTMGLTVKRGSKKEHSVKVLRDGGQRTDNGAREVADDLIRRARAADGPDALRALAEREAIIKRRDWLRQEAPDIADEVDDAFRIAQPADTATPDNPTAQEGRSDEDMGEGFNDEAPAWRAAVDQHLEAVAAAGTVIDLKGAINRFEQTRRALPDEAIAEVDAAEKDAADRLNPLGAG